MYESRQVFYFIGLQLSNLVPLHIGRKFGLLGRHFLHSVFTK
jgi:hypothetical protein